MNSIVLDAHEGGCTPASPCKNCRVASFLRGKLGPADFDSLLSILRKGPAESLDATLIRSIDDVPELGYRVLNCLKAENIHYIGDLVQRTENDILRIPNLGRKSLDKVRDGLSELGLQLGMKNIEWKPPAPSEPE